jgi:phage terminase large subunit-like protein
MRWHVSSLDALTQAEQDEWLSTLTDEQAAYLLYDWLFWAREKQTPPPGDWLTWLILAGRGFGKTRTGAEFVRLMVDNGLASRIALVGRTAADVRDVMVEGESGLLSVYPAWMRPKYEPSKRRITFHNGAVATTYSGDKPDQLRGPQHDLAWCDEMAAWRYPEAWDQLQFGLRLGEHPRTVVTTTPRPTKLIRELVKDDTVYVTTGSTYENAANLAAPALAQLQARYEGSRLGRQELNAEILDDVPGALWTRDLIDSRRRRESPELVRVVVAIDPAVTSTDESNETGIVVCGVDAGGNGFVIEDASVRGTPTEWARRALWAYYEHQADRLVVEVNQGGDMVETVIRALDNSVSVRSVRASRGKYTRAEPVSALYEQGQIFHVGIFAELEDQMCTWVPGEDSPDRLDALVWGFTDLMVGASSEMKISDNPFTRRR